MISVVFTGDVAFVDYLKGKERDRVVDDRVLAFLQSADAVVANIETPITGNTGNIMPFPKLVSSPAVVENYKAMNFTVWDLSNNHIADYGAQGVRDTVELAKANGCMPFGIGTLEPAQYPEPLILGEKNCKIGLLAVSDNFSHMSGVNYVLPVSAEKTIHDQIQALKAEVRYVVVVAHLGREFAALPIPQTREKCKSLLLAGADIVVVHHPHVVENYEKVGDKIVFYSLGNFIFDSEYLRSFNYTDKGILLKIEFAPSGYQWEYLPTWLDREKSIVCAVPKTETPAVFRDLNDEEYRRLFPLAAKALLKNEREIAAIAAKTAAGKARKTKKRDILYPLKRFYRPIKRSLNQYKIMLRVNSLFAGRYKSSKNADLYDYIINS